jgi:hypothetical protein
MTAADTTARAFIPGYLAYTRVIDAMDTYFATLLWSAAGFVDIEIRCLAELESWNAETEIQSRVHA